MKYHIVKKDYFSNRGVVALSLLLCFAVAGGFLIYLVQINGLVDCSYQIRGYQQKISQLKDQEERLETRIAQWRSPANLYSQMDSLKMVEVGKIIYLQDKKSVAIND